MRIQLQPSIHTRSFQGAHVHLMIAQFNELSRRENVSILVAFFGLITITWVHWGSVPTANSMGWLSCMALVLLTRYVVAQKNKSINEASIHLTTWRNLCVVVAALYGFCWGTMLFLLDTGKLDFYFMFKFTSLAAAMGITVNTLSALLPVYTGFVTSLFLTIIFFIFTNAPYLNPDERSSLLSGVLIYFLLLLIAARKASELTRVAHRRRPK